jgi:hypothetical protein
MGTNGHIVNDSGVLVEIYMYDVSRSLLRKEILRGTINKLNEPI